MNRSKKYVEYSRPISNTIFMFHIEPTTKERRSRERTFLCPTDVTRLHHIYITYSCKSACQLRLQPYNNYQCRRHPTKACIDVKAPLFSIGKTFHWRKNSIKPLPTGKSPTPPGPLLPDHSS